MTQASGGILTGIDWLVKFENHLLLVDNTSVHFCCTNFLVSSPFSAFYAKGTNCADFGDDFAGFGGKTLKIKHAPSKGLVRSSGSELKESINCITLYVVIVRLLHRTTNYRSL